MVACLYGVVIRLVFRWRKLSVMFVLQVDIVDIAAYNLRGFFKGLSLNDV